MRLKNLLTTAVATAAMLATAVIAADHFDSPLANRDVRKDITDVYAFRSPDPARTATHLVVALNVSSTAQGAQPSPLFSNDAKYNIHVDNTGDYVADAVVTVTFAGTAPQTFRVEGLGAPITGNVTGAGASPIVATAGTIKVFCGPRDDPFFFDLNAFKDFVGNGPYTPAIGLRRTGMGNPANFFAGANVGSIVLEIPITALTGMGTPNVGTIRTWASITEPQ